MVNKVLSMCTALLLVMSVFLPSTAAVHASDDHTLYIAQYTKTSGNVEGTEGSNQGTYKGKWTASIPMGKVLSNLEGKIKEAAGKGYYPHGKDGVNEIAYVEYSVNFPEGVTIDDSDITMSNTTTIFNTAAFKREVNGQTVKFKFPLWDENWKGIYNRYNNDGGASSEKTIEINIPYSVDAKSFDDAKAANGKDITASGSFETHPSGRFYSFKKEIYNTDISSIPLASNFSDSNVFTQPNTNPSESTQSMDLDADLMLENNTGNDAITVAKNGEMNFVGSLDTKAIKDQMEKIHQAHPAKAEEIVLRNLKTGFIAQLKLPNELSFDGDKQATLSGGNNIFNISETSVEDQTATVKFELVNADQIDTFAKLQDAINKVEDTLKVQFKTVKFNEKAQADTNYVVTGSVNGYLKADATVNNTINFDLTWNGKQTDAGKSNKYPNGIAIAVKYTEPENIETEGILYGDLLVNDNTQHDKVYVAKKDDSLKMTGLLDVSPIKDTLKSLEEKYESANRPDDIKVENIKTSFTAIMTLPDELDFKAGFDADKDVELTEANGKFKITKAELSSDRKTITVVMSLAKQATTFKDIKDAVEGVEDQLKVNVNGVMFNNKAIANTNYTIKGNISGNFSATATNETGKTINFNYNWTGVQLEGGEDSTAPTSKAITLTLKYENETNPDTPENPTKPDNPNKPDNPVEPNNPEVTVPTENGDSPATTSPTKPSNVKPSAIPNTGDAPATILYLVTVLLSMAGIAVLDAKRKGRSIR